MSNTQTTQSRAITDREEARALLTRKANRPDPEFSIYDPAIPREHARYCLRWLDCAPEGARFLTAPLLDWNGVPCGPNMGPLRPGCLLHVYRRIIERDGGLHLMATAHNS